MMLHPPPVSESARGEREWRGGRGGVYQGFENEKEGFVHVLTVVGFDRIAGVAGVGIVEAGGRWDTGVIHRKGVS